MKTMPIAVLALVAIILNGCASAPTGPSVMVLPGTGKTFDQFRADDAECRHFALDEVGGTTPGQAGTDAGVRSAALGTIVGAVAGAAIGGHQGAGAGAGTGLIAGSMIGAGESRRSGWETQRRYDTAYIQCMYAKGHQVPVSGSLAGRRVASAVPEPRQAAAGSYPPPPPPGYPPPPPPDYAPPPSSGGSH